MSDEIKILPCPFCGGRPILKFNQIMNNYQHVDSFYSITCLKCEIEFKKYDSWRNEIVEYWNQRA